MSRVCGIDVGGTKIAAGIVDLGTGRVTERSQIATRPERGADAVLDDCLALAEALSPTTIGVAVCELGDRAGRTGSASTVDWRGRDLAAAFGAVAPARIESDVRAAALAEARFGAGAGRGSFLYVTVSTGISHAFVIDGVPWPGARGSAIVLGAPPVEEVASGLALAARFGRSRAEDVLADAAAAGAVADAAAAIGQSIAALVNALDPESVVIGGGLGSDSRVLALIVDGLRPFIWADATRTLPVVPAALSGDAGIVGAALATPPGPVTG